MNIDQARLSKGAMIGLVTIAALSLLLALALAAILLFQDDSESRRFDQAMAAVGAGISDNVELSGTVNYTAVDGNDRVLGYVVNGVRGDTEVLCRAVVSSKEVECVDLPVKWLYFEDAWPNTSS